MHTHSLDDTPSNNKMTIDQDQRGCEKWKEKDQKQFYTDPLYLLVRRVSGRLLRLVLLPITHSGDCEIVNDTPGPRYPSSPATLPRPGASWVPLTLSSTNALAGVWSTPLHSGCTSYQYIIDKNSTGSFQPLRTTLMRCL